jgi:hypothetical protein
MKSRFDEPVGARLSFGPKGTRLPSSGKDFPIRSRPARADLSREDLVKLPISLPESGERGGGTGCGNTEAYFLHSDDYGKGIPSPSWRTQPVLSGVPRPIAHRPNLLPIPVYGGRIKCSFTDHARTG